MSGRSVQACSIECVPLISADVVEYAPPPRARRARRWEGSRCSRCREGESAVRVLQRARVRHPSDDHGERGGGVPVHLAGVRAAAGRTVISDELEGSDLFEDVASRRGVLRRAVPRTLVEVLPALFSSWVALHFVSGCVVGCGVMC